MLTLTFSQRLLAFAIISWLGCVITDICTVFPISPFSDTIAAICFLAAVAAAFVAGAVYGHEAEYERAEREKQLAEDLEKQPLLGEGWDEKGFMSCGV